MPKRKLTKIIKRSPRTNYKHTIGLASVHGFNIQVSYEFYQKAVDNGWVL